MSDVPEPLQADTREARLIKTKFWDRLWQQNQHFMGVIVGREGTGKSHSGIKLAEVVDPTFNADRVIFEPVEYIKQLKEWKDNGETQGKVVVIDEAGVGMGVRTWHDKDQIMLNQILQIVRSENMGVIFTLPRLKELDSQTEGRLHAYLETMQIRPGQWLKLKWLDVDPTRDGRDKIYREYPELTIGGYKQTIKRLTVSPPTSEIIENYEQRKEAFQNDQYDEAIEQMDDEADDEKSVKQIAMEIADGGIGDYISRHNQNNSPYINKGLIRADYELSQNDSKLVKDLLQRQFDSNQLESHA
jgi:hypothetical protein